MFRLRWVWLCLLVVAIVGTPGSPAADEKEKEKDDAVEVSATDESGPQTSGPTDEAFNRFVDPDFLSRAAESLDPEALTDAAIQTAEGERILGRASKAVPAAQVFDTALRAAVEKRAPAALKRLATRMKDIGRDDLATKAEAAIGLAGAARAAGPPADLGFDKLEADEQELVGVYMAQVEAAQIRGDREALVGLVNGLESFPGFTEKQLAYLKSVAEKAQKETPEKPSEGAQALMMLAGESRLSLDANGRVLNWCAAKYGQQVMRGECAELAGAAFINVGVFKSREEKPAAGDYVWGKLVRAVTPGRNTTGDVRPGDVLQYRNAVYTNGNGTSTATHHTSVVKSVAVSGSYLTIYQQNSGGKRYVTTGTVNLKGLTKGTIWIYRPYFGVNTFPVQITNSAKSTISFRIGSTKYSLAPGKTQLYKVNKSNGYVTYGISWPATSSGGIYIDGGEVGYLEGQRVYTITQSGSNFAFRKTGWLSYFYYSY